VQSFPVNVIDAVTTADTKGGTPQLLVTVQVQAGPAVPPTDNRSQFLPEASMTASFPVFLADIKPEDVRGTKIVTFETANPKPPAPAGGPPFRVHTIDGQKFDGNIGQVVLLNKVEEWKIENRTVKPQIDHPFHIHINPFQVVEVFDPNEQFLDANNNLIDRYVVSGGIQRLPGQCFLDPSNPETWKPCTPPAQTTNLIWWDVFPIPSGRSAPVGLGPEQIVIPGYFKMRSRFVDYTGQYVIHCHILSREDRGMMTIVQVVPYKTEYSHK
jgi:FtsP/CotA-like multicopper oxidase with cupredoxin domain